MPGRAERQSVLQGTAVEADVRVRVDVEALNEGDGRRMEVR